MTSDPWWAAALAAAVALVGGLAVPWVVARLPEPEPEPDEQADDQGDEQADERDAAVDVPLAPPVPDKVPYADLPGPRSALRCGLAAALAGGVLGWSRGWAPDLPVWVFLSVLGTALAWVDWRTRLLPRALVVPSYAVVAVLLGIAYAVERDTDQVLRAVIAWVVLFVVYFVLWFLYPRGLGYGDVRLSGVLGMALGWVSWQALVIGAYAGFLLGAVVGGLLAVLKVVDRRGYPFGPFMLVGAVVGVVWSGLLTG